VSTTNDEWVETFIDRESTDQIIHKLASIKNTSLYCNANTDTFASLSVEEWKSTMQSLIFVDESTEAPKSLQYVLQPANMINLRVVHDARKLTGSNKISITLMTHDFKFEISRDQLLQILETVRIFSMLERQLLLGMYKPRQRPTESPLLWWKYAVTLISGRKASAVDKV